MKNLNRVHLVLICILMIFQSGCSLFFGNIRPVEEKSNSYGIYDLSYGNTEWVRLDGNKESAEPPLSGISDVAFQSRKTASIISINSACKSFPTDRKESLASLTRELLLGLSDITYREEKEIIVNSHPALQTTVQGKMNGEIMKLRTVVLEKSQCVYDLMFISRPEKFPLNEPDFSRFVSSLNIK